MALDVSEENPMSIPAMTANLRDYIIRKITDNDEDPESNYAVSSINTKVLEISVVKETTKRSKVRTLPLVYDEVYSAYGASFDCNRYKNDHTTRCGLFLHTNNLHGCYLVIPAVYLVLPLTVEAVKS